MRPETLSASNRIVFLCLLPVVLVVAGCRQQSTMRPKMVASVPVSAPQPTVALGSSEFSRWKDIPVDVQPAVKPYTVQPDLSNVTNAADFKLSDAAKAALSKNAFFVEPAWYAEFFSVYEENRYDMYLPDRDVLIPVPSFVTTDAIVHTYHLYFDYLLRKLEKEKLYSLLQSLLDGMISEAANQRDALLGTEWQTAAERNVGFLCVARKLLDESADVPEYIREAVSVDLASIAAHETVAGVAVSNPGGAPILSEDFTQYIVRGHYTKHPKLKRYFKAMMWLGRIAFRQKEEDETRSALLLTTILANNEQLRKTWADIYEPTAFFVGKADDLSFFDYQKVAEKIYGAGWTADDLKDNAKFARFAEQVRRLQPPKINSIPIFSPGIQPDREAETKGFRLMGQRYTIDADIFQRLVYREVGNKKGEIPPVPDEARLLPTGLDIPAAMGSPVAEALLREKGEFDYFNYPENMQKMRTYITALDEAVWRENLYWGWMFSLRPLLDVRAEGFPTFMINEAWARKDLQTFLASWTELKHDTILYAKQVYAEMGAAPERREERDDRGYVEPNPWLFARIASLADYTRSGLLERALLSDQDAESLQRLYDLCVALKDISVKELQNEKLTDKEYELIRSFGGSLEHFWTDALRDQPEALQTLNENPAAIVTDVATDPASGRVLQEAIGRIYPIFVVVPVDGKLRLARGAVFSYYEFTRPAAARLTDEKWRRMIDNNQAPPRPEWTNLFIVEEAGGD